jgi:hypothetical protein
MAKQKGRVKIRGTVDDNLNFYYDMVWGYLLRLLPGVDSHRFWNDPAFEGSRRSSRRFGEGNIMSSIIYRFVPQNRRYRYLFKQVRAIAIVCLKHNMSKADVFTAIYTFLEQEKRISLTREQFELLVASFEQELSERLNEPKEEKVKKARNKLELLITAPLQQEDNEFLALYMDDYEWKVRFEGTFPEDHQVPLFLLQHVA